MSNTALAIWAVLLIGLFGFLWKTGQLVRLSVYVTETREELRKCAWPSVEELKGSTLLVMVTVALLGLFTVVVDFFLSQMVQWMLKL